MTFSAQPEPQVQGKGQSVVSPLYTYAFFPQPDPQLLSFIRQTEGSISRYRCLPRWGAELPPLWSRCGI